MLEERPHLLPSDFTPLNEVFLLPSPAILYMKGVTLCLSPSCPDECARLPKLVVGTDLESLMLFVLF